MDRKIIKPNFYQTFIILSLGVFIFGFAANDRVPKLLASSNEQPGMGMKGGNQIFMPIVSLPLTITTTADGKDWNPGDGRCETADGNKICTLRAYIQETNAKPGLDSIYVPAGQYTLTSVGADEDNGDAGDLDILDDLIIVGENPATTVIDGNSTDRIFDVIGSRVSIFNVAVTNGGSSGTSGGGGILSSGYLTLTNSIITDNRTIKQGGGIRGASNTVALFDSVVSNNVGGGAGGGIFAGFLTLEDSVVDANIVTASGSGSDGAGLYVQYSAVIDKSTISNNRLLDGKGGGIYFPSNAQATITRSNIEANVINGNSTGILGAGIYSESSQTITIRDTTIQANDTSFSGGGIYHNPAGAAGTMILERVTLRQNVAASRGAGIYNAGEIYLINVTVSDNRATGNLNEEGGGIFHKDSTMLITNSTISENKAELGGAIYQESGSVVLQNTILANNIATAIINPGDPDTHNCFGSITSGGNNIEDGVYCLLNAPSDLSNTDPLLLVITPGSVWTDLYPISSNSPAIDSGNNATCPAEDQRGVARPIDGNNDGVAVCDRGSYEYP